ncbi:MAG: hypothetical protein NTU91_00955 [Chloroflexi bacterium]|nr:hypothetical protein [Chloroflexota bacterium]
MAGNTVILDACLVITFGNAEALDTIAGLRLHHVAIACRAAGEVLWPPAADQLAGRIADDSIHVEAIDIDVAAEQQALARFDASPRFRNRGDAEVLALAATRGWIVGSDEVAIRRVAFEEFGAGRVAGTLDFLKWAVGERRLTLDQAVDLLRSLDVGPALLRRIAAAGQTPEGVLST